MDFKKARAIFEKVQMNGEEIGKLKLEPFSIQAVERVRAIYKENERLIDEVLRSIKSTNANGDEK